MLIDMHAHTGGVSRCCKIDAQGVLLSLREARLDGIILTNHYTKGYVDDGDATAFAERYIEEYRLTRALGVEMGLTVFFGVEVTMERYGGMHILVYGVDEDFVREHPEMYGYTLEQLRGAVRNAGGFLVHAHPLRVSRGKENGMVDLSMMDGIEMNCHIKYNGPMERKIRALAREHGLFITAGGDYHADTERTRCGVFLPDGIGSTREAIEHIMKAETVEYLIEEPDGSTRRVRISKEVK